MSKRLYTYAVPFSFTMQFTFPESDVTTDPDSNDEDSSPTHKAIEDLTKEIETYLGEHYAVNSVEIDDDELLFLGATDDE